MPLGRGDVSGIINATAYTVFHGYQLVARCQSMLPFVLVPAVFIFGIQKGMGNKVEDKARGNLIDRACSSAALAPSTIGR